MLIASIVATRDEDWTARAAGAALHADLLEVRLDAAPAAALAWLEREARRAGRPLIATCRRTLDGGAFAGGEADRLALLRRARRAGVAFLDVERDSAAESLMAEGGEVRYILSHHERADLPDDLDRVAADLAARPEPAMVKLVAHARRLEDNLRLRSLLGARGDGRLIAFCMGAAGELSRVMALAWGSAATYGAAGPAAAPGQLAVGEMAEEMAVRERSESTGVVGIVGEPVEHSLSPAVHNAAYHRLGCDLVYVRLPTPGIDAALALARQLPLRGFSVTHPHKTAVLARLDRVDPRARAIGAVNTVFQDGGAWVGENTDAAAGVAPLARRLPLAGARVAVLGAGGVARALAWELAARDAVVTLYHRSAERGAEAARSLGVAHAPREDLARRPYDVLINATPVGMAPATDATPVPGEWLRGRLVYDAIYRPAPTRLLREAAERGLETLGGLDMFLEQAGAQVRRFTGCEPPVEEMRRALLARVAVPVGRESAGA